MSLAELLRNALPVAIDALRRIQSWGAAHARLLFTLPAVMFTVWTLLFLYQRSFQKEIVLLTGPAGSSSWYVGNRIGSELQQSQQLPGINYAVRIESIGGFEATETRISADVEGSTIGFLQNRARDSSSLRTLLPLDYDYLHVLCRVGFLASQIPETSSNYRFEAIEPRLKPGRVFVGPQGSGTRQMAARIFRHFGVNEAGFETLLAPSISDWEQGRAALSRDAIDLMFYLGPIGSTTISRIVDDKSAVLVDLGEFQQALVQHENFAVWPVAFSRNSYNASRWSHETDRALGTVPDFVDAGLREAWPARREFQFCPNELQTVAARRLLVASDKMSRDDAFQIAEATKAAIGGDSRVIGFWEPQPP
ncbi:MAG: hypothetical protein EHM42_10485, partial [Planctomycetaceae bacterium]